MRKLILPTVGLAMACTILNSGCIMAARAATQPRQPDLSKIFDDADTNGDGVITRAEFRAARERLFARLDRNGDGFIDEADKPTGFAARRGGSDRFAQLITRFDKDGDGRVSKAEFVDGPSPLFDSADTDHNGELSREEVAAMKAKLQALQSSR